MSVLCSTHCAKLFLSHIFPDAIVVCGRHVAVAPYIDPDLALARQVRHALRDFRACANFGPLY